MAPTPIPRVSRITASAAQRHLNLVSGRSRDGSSWCPARKGFLVPAAALAKLVPGKLKAGRRRRTSFFPRAWRTPRVVHITPWGAGEQAVPSYLARYVFRVKITNAQIVGLDDEAVTIRCKRLKSSRWRNCRIAGEEFIRRFLRHVLPQGFHTKCCGCAASARHDRRWKNGSRSHRNGQSIGSRSPTKPVGTASGWRVG